MISYGPQRLRFLALISFCIFARPLEAHFDSLTQALGLNRDDDILSTKQKISSLFAVKEDLSKVPSKARGKSKPQIQRTPLETKILDLHRMAMEAQVSDQKIWKSFLLDLTCFQNIAPAAHLAFRKNQILASARTIQQFQESYRQHLGDYFLREKPQMIAKSLDALKRMQDEYHLIFRIYTFIVGYWLEERSEFVTPALNLGVKLAQFQWIQNDFETEFQSRLTAQRPERLKEKEPEKGNDELSHQVEGPLFEGPKEKEVLTPSLDLPEITQDAVTVLPKAEASLPEELKEKEVLLPTQEIPEITRDDMALNRKEMLERLKDHILPEEIYFGDLSRSVTYKELVVLMEKYQAPFDRLWEAAFPKPLPPLENTTQEDSIQETGEKEPEKGVIVEKKEEVVPPYEIPSHLTTFRHPGTFELLKNYYGLEIADHFLFLKVIQILKTMTTASKEDSQKLTEKLKYKWSLHVKTASETEFPEVFLRAFSDWNVANQELEGPRTQLERTQPLKEKYDLFMRMSGKIFLEMITTNQEKKAEQLLNAVIPNGWNYHQSTISKKDPKEKVKPLEEELRKLWAQG